MADYQEWEQESHIRYVKHHSWWMTWIVLYDEDDDKWYWIEIDHDGWDGTDTVDVVSESSEPTFDTWQAAADYVDQYRDKYG